MNGDTVTVRPFEVQGLKLLSLETTAGADGTAVVLDRENAMQLFRALGSYLYTPEASHVQIPDSI